MPGTTPHVTGTEAVVIGQMMAGDRSRANGAAVHEPVMALRAQASAVAERYPELFAYLVARDRQIHDTLVWFRPGDPEAYLGWDRLERLLDNLSRLPAGIADVVRE